MERTEEEVAAIVKLFGGDDDLHHLEAVELEYLKKKFIPSGFGEEATLAAELWDHVPDLGAPLPPAVVAMEQRPLSGGSSSFGASLDHYPDGAEVEIEGGCAVELVTRKRPLNEAPAKIVEYPSPLDAEENPPASRART